MNELHKMPDVIFLISGTVLVVIALNVGITILLVRHHVQKYKDRLDRARTEAERDRLTGLYNRNGFERRAEEFLEADSPGGALLLLDLDDFKQINDREGHPEGDRVLQIFAQCLADSFRKEDLIWRLGGDEFAVLLGNPVPEPAVRTIRERSDIGQHRGGSGRPVIPVAPEQYGRVAALFFRAALDPSDRAFQAVCLCAALSAGAVIYGRIRHGKWLRLTWILPAAGLVTAGYYVGMLYMYLHSMPAEEALRMAGFERYACSAAVLYAGFLIMGATVDIEHSFAVDIDERGPYRAYSSPGAKRRYQYAVLVTMAVGINFLYSEYSGLQYIRSEYESSLPAQAERAVGDRWYAGAETDPHRYRIRAPGGAEQAAEGELRYIYRYFLWVEDVEAE